MNSYPEMTDELVDRISETLSERVQEHLVPEQQEHLAGEFPMASPSTVRHALFEGLIKAGVDILLEDLCKSSCPHCHIEPALVFISRTIAAHVEQRLSKMPPCPGKGVPHAQLAIVKLIIQPPPDLDPSAGEG